MLSSGKHASVLTSFECVAGINFYICLYLTNRIQFICENTENIFFLLLNKGSIEWTNDRFKIFDCIFRKILWNFYGNGVCRLRTLSNAGWPLRVQTLTQTTTDDSSFLYAVTGNYNCEKKSVSWSCQFLFEHLDKNGLGCIRHNQSVHSGLEKYHNVASFHISPAVDKMLEWHIPLASIFFDRLF